MSCSTISMHRYCQHNFFVFLFARKEIFVLCGGLTSDSFGIGRREDLSGSYSFLRPSLAMELIMMMVVVVMMMMMNCDDDNDG